MQQQQGVRVRPLRLGVHPLHMPANPTCFERVFVPSVPQVGFCRREGLRNPHAHAVADAIIFAEQNWGHFDAIHASPPCQGYSHLTPEAHRANYPKLIPQLRAMLRELGKPYVIENVAGARRELENPVMLCGSMFGLRTQRHRYFETSFPVAAPCACDHSQIPLLVTTASKASREKRFALGMKPKSVKNAPAAYGIDWMSCEGLKECIPPAFTSFLGRAIIQTLTPGRSNAAHKPSGDNPR